MRSRTKILYILIVVFLVAVFLDQNRTPVPIKIFVGNPFQVGLTLIILISMAVAVILTLGVVYLWNRRKDKDR